MGSVVSWYESGGNDPEDRGHTATCTLLLCCVTAVTAVSAMPFVFCIYIYIHI